MFFCGCSLQDVPWEARRLHTEPKASTKPGHTQLIKSVKHSVCCCRSRLSVILVIPTFQNVWNVHREIDHHTSQWQLQGKVKCVPAAAILNTSAKFQNNQIREREWIPLSMEREQTDALMTTALNCYTICLEQTIYPCFPTRTSITWPQGVIVCSGPHLCWHAVLIWSFVLTWHVVGFITLNKRAGTDPGRTLGDLMYLPCTI